RFKGRIALKFLVLFIAAILLFGGVVMALWNAILPAVLGVKAITFLQALGILALSKILFGSFGRRGGWQGGRGHQMRANMKEKWSKMTPEEREKFKAEWSNRCGGRWGREMQKAGNASPEE
ncbi:MAG: hypothetical protein ABI594_06810, partial [Ginsengibacter sp.]